MRSSAGFRKQRPRFSGKIARGCSKQSVRSSDLIRLLAYQHRLLSDQAYDPEFDNAQRDKFKKFLKYRVGLDIDDALADAGNKTITFSYPDLHEHVPQGDLSVWLKNEFEASISGVTVDRVYAIYVRHDAPQIGFTVAVVFQMSLHADTAEAFEDLFVPSMLHKAKFHEEFREVWKRHADKPRTLPVVIFDEEPKELFSWGHRKPSLKQFCGSPTTVKLPLKRSAHLERGFPYVSYVLHSGISSAVPEKIHRCDLALLMALPGFVERDLELMVTQYRSELTSVQEGLEHNDFVDAEKRYNRSWNSFQRVQRIAPKTRAAVQRILQKYPGKSFFAAIAKDNIKLIEFTVTPAIAATEQVRANIQAFAQQKLQGSIRRMQLLTTFLTVILAVGTAATAWVVVGGTSKMEITEIRKLAEIAQPIRVSSEPIPDEANFVKVPITIVPLSQGTYPLRNSVLLHFNKREIQAKGTVPTPMAAAGASPLELLVLQQDGAVLAEGTLASSSPPVAIQFSIPKKLFNNRRKYYLQIEQDNWRLKLPIVLELGK